MNIDSIITEWTYRLEKGYPDCPEDYIELRNVLREQTDLSKPEQDAIVRRAMGLEEQDEEETSGMLSSDPNSATDDFADLLQLLKTKNKIGQLQQLAEYTKKHYKPSFETVFSITDIDQYTDGYDGHYTLGNNNKTNLPISDYTSPGIAAEAIIFTYLNSKFNTNIQHITSQAKGVDGEDGNNKFEVKTATTGNINLNLQTTFFSNDPNKFYIFGFRSSGGYKFNSISPVYIISSQLLRRISLGEEIYSQLGTESQISDILTTQVEAGLEKTNFKEQIIAAITTGETGEFAKQFDIGNNVSIVFKIFIQPKKF